MTDKEVARTKRFQSLIKAGYSEEEASRVAYGWSNPEMRNFWKDLWADRDQSSPKLEQKEVLFLLTKASFGKRLDGVSKLHMSETQMDEICLALVLGIQAGHVNRSSRAKREATLKNLLHTAKVELNRMIREDKRFEKITKE